MLSIRMEDVIAVLNSCMLYLIAIVVCLALAVIVTVAVKGLPKAKKGLARKGS